MEREKTFRHPKLRLGGLGKRREVGDEEGLRCWLSRLTPDINYKCGKLDSLLFPCRSFTSRIN